MSEQELLVSHADGVTRLTLNRPDALNTLRLSTIAAMQAALDQAREAGARVVVLAANGRAFCAGVDLAQFDGGEVSNLQVLEQIQELVRTMLTFPAPIVAVVNGAARAGGFELAVASDVIVASAKATFGDGHLNVGVIPGGGGATVLPRRLPLNLAKYLVLTGAVLSADDALAHGLVAQVVPPEELEEAAAAVVANLAAKSPLGLRVTKDLFRRGLLIPDPAEAVTLELAANVDYSTSNDMAEGIAAFLAKRPPNYTGT